MSDEKTENRNPSNLTAIRIEGLGGAAWNRYLATLSPRERTLTVKRMRGLNQFAGHALRWPKPSSFPRYIHSGPSTQAAE